MSIKPVCFAASLLFAGSCAANGPFVQARVGIASLDHFRIDDDEPAGQLLVGMRRGYFGVEAGYLRTQRFTDHFVSQRLTNFTIDYANEIEGPFLGLNARCTLGEGPWHATGRVGAVRWSMDYSFVPSRGPTINSSAEIADTDLYVGAGLGRDFGERFAVGVALDYFRLDGDEDEVVRVDASMRAWSLALEYRF